jgi:hypothetical protein
LPGWDTFAVIIGGAAGALIGLLFVSVSIRIEVISASPDFRNRSAETLSLFTTVLLVGVSKKVAWRGQPRRSDNHTSQTTTEGPCQRLARNCATRSLAPPRVPVLSCISDLDGCVVT